MIDEHDAIMVIFSEPQVRHCKTAHFIKTFGPAVLPEGPELAAMMGKFQFLVEGWNDDPQELYSIPEVRKFYQHFHRVWPYWFYFCDLRTETLTMATISAEVMMACNEVFVSRSARSSCSLGFRLRTSVMICWSDSGFWWSAWPTQPTPFFIRLKASR